MDAAAIAKLCEVSITKSVYSGHGTIGVAIVDFVLCKMFTRCEPGEQDTELLLHLSFFTQPCVQDSKSFMSLSQLTCPTGMTGIHR